MELTLGERMNDSIEGIQADAAEVFGYRRGIRPQERAHKYLRENQVRRDYDDTALLCVVRDLIARTEGVCGDGGCRETLREIADVCAEALGDDGE